METRTEKYKNYRASLIKDGSQYYSGKSRTTTATLPISEVINASQMEDEKINYRGYKTKKTLIYALTIFLIIAVIAGIIVLGIFAFRG